MSSGRQGWTSLALVFTFVAVIPSSARMQGLPVVNEAPRRATPPSSLTGNLSFDVYLAGVGRSNLELAAARTEVTIAQARIGMARTFPDPSVYAGVAQVDVSRQGAPTATVVGVNVPLELGAKRGHRIDVAHASHAVARAQLDEFLWSLRANAAKAFIDALYSRLVLERKRRTLDSLEQLVRVNEVRLEAGDIGEATLLQSRVEVQRFSGDVLAAQAEVRASELELAIFLGKAPSTASSLSPQGDIAIGTRAYDLSSLLRSAFANRPDLRAAKLGIKRALEQIELAQANRVVNVALAANWQHNFSTEATPFKQPNNDTVGANLWLPLPFSNLYQGEVRAARGSAKQQRTLLHAAELRVAVEVRQALARYDAMVKRLELYRGGLLQDADRVLEASLYQYKRGAASLLEVLNAQRTVNEVYLTYYDVLADHARALVSLEQAAGVWDVRF